MVTDENLCAGLVQQNICSDPKVLFNSESMLPTQQPNIEDSIDNGGSISNQPEDIDTTQSMECRPSSFFSGNDALAVAFSVLERAAWKNVFAIHDVVIVCSAA